eukprot:TRINITY_DN365_c1_g2_i1.p1 TRINITY_DN365_c1_g2~~TRINITY_DN365_c1_g2_i1.p1  ORF type:complete len:319 (+),score=73.32 TRINITY_DN365_c1_g2_i1:93-1049(+)
MPQRGTAAVRAAASLRASASSGAAPARERRSTAARKRRDTLPTPHPPTTAPAGRLSRLSSAPTLQRRGSSQRRLSHSCEVPVFSELDPFAQRALVLWTCAEAETLSVIPTEVVWHLAGYVGGFTWHPADGLTVLSDGRAARHAQPQASPREADEANAWLGPAVPWRSGLCFEVDLEMFYTPDNPWVTAVGVADPARVRSIGGALHESIAKVSIDRYRMVLLSPLLVDTDLRRHKRFEALRPETGLVLRFIAEAAYAPRKGPRGAADPAQWRITVQGRAAHDEQWEQGPMAIVAAEQLCVCFYAWPGSGWHLRRVAQLS